jgi:hypothetical protein
MVRTSARFSTQSFLVAWAMLLAAVAKPGAQTAPTPPLQGQLATQGTITKFYKGLNVVAVTTVDGAEHLFHYTKELVVHGNPRHGEDALDGVKEGSTIVVHYTKEGANESAQEIDRLGAEGLKETEGVVTRVDRGRKEITLTLANGTTETLQLTERAAADAGKEIGDVEHTSTRVVVYYTDEAGHKVAHYFRKAS